MKKLVFLLLLLLGVSVSGFCQDKVKRTRPDGMQIFQGYHTNFKENVIIPLRDTVIMQGEEIEIGAWLSKSWDFVIFEIVGFGKSKKKDYEKGIYLKKLKPNKTTTYEMISYSQDNIKYGHKRTVYVAKNEEERRAALEKLLPMQRKDFIGIYEELEERPATIRFLDPPLHEFLPHNDEEIAELAATMGLTFEDLKNTVESLHEFNPMMGHRGCILYCS